MPTEAKELHLMEFGEADRGQSRLVPYLVASNSYQNVALCSAEDGIISYFGTILGMRAIGADLSWLHPFPEDGQIFW